MGLRNLSRALLDRTYYLPPELADQAYPPAARDALAAVLDALAAAIHEVAPVAAGQRPGQLTDSVADHLVDVEHRTEQLGALLYVDPHNDPAAWQQHGALLAALDRLRVEIDAAIRPPTTTWHPAPLVGRSGDAMRRHHHPRLDRLRRTAAGRSQTQDTPEL